MAKKAPLPRLWRHHYSGVWIGYLVGKSELPGHLKFEGRRIWSWSGNRLECSELAKKGVAKGDRLGLWTTADIAVEGSVEMLPITPEVAEAARAAE